MDPNLKDQTLSKLTKAENILICAPENGNLDQLASALALYLSMVKIGKNVQISAKRPTVGDARKLYGVADVGKLTSATNNLVVVIDNAIESVDKVTHFLENDKLKIVIHPLTESKGVTKEQVSFESSPKKPDFIIAIGIRTFDQLKNIFTHEQIIDPNAWIVSINKGEKPEK